MRSRILVLTTLAAIPLGSGCWSDNATEPSPAQEIAPPAAEAPTELLEAQRKELAAMCDIIVSSIGNRGSERAEALRTVRVSTDAGKQLREDLADTYAKNPLDGNVLLVERVRALGVVENENCKFLVSEME